MCRGSQGIEEREPLKIKAFHVHLSFSITTNLLQIKKPAFLYDSLTLHFLPRINGASLEIEGSSLRPDTPGFITLHPLVSSSAAAHHHHHHQYGSRERVRVSEGSRFEIYASDDVKLLKGTFRKDGDRDNEDPRGVADVNKWKLDCRCQLELEEDSHFLREAEVCVEVEGRGVGSMISDKVAMVLPRRRGRRHCFEWLEEIPEEREVDESDGGGCCCCSSCGSDDEKAGRDESVGDRRMDDGTCSTDTVTVPEAEGGGYWAAVEGVWIWVMCLGGVAYLLSKTSSTRVLARTTRQNGLSFFNKIKYYHW